MNIISLNKKIKLFNYSFSDSFGFKAISCNCLKQIFFFKFLSKLQKCNSIISKYIKPGIIKKMLMKKGILNVKRFFIITKGI